MGRVCRSWLAHLITHFQMMSVHNIFEPVSSDMLLLRELPLIHIPQFGASYSRIHLPDLMDILQGE